MTHSLESSSQDLVIYQQGGTSDYGKPTVLRPLYSAASPHNNNSVVVSNVLGAILHSWGSNLLCGSLHGHIRTQPNNASAFTLAINVLRAQFIQYRRRIRALEAEIDDLRHDNMMYHSDVGALESELSNMRANYYSEIFERRQDNLAAKKDKDEIKILKAEIIVLKDKNSQVEHDKDEVNLLKAEIITLKAAGSQAELDNHEEIRELKAEIEVFREESSQSELDKYEIKLLKAEVDVLKEGHCRAELDKCEIKLLKAEIDTLREEHAQAENFIQAMVDIKLYDSVLSDAAQSVLEGGDAEDALIESVKAASTRKGSAWSRIIPAVVGPRSPDHYLSAIDLALKARKELQERRRISGFWKLNALMHPANTIVITPSSSQISDICDEMAKEQNRPKEPALWDQSDLPITQVVDTAKAAPVTTVAPSSNLSPFKSEILRVLEPSLVDTIVDIHAESTETIKVSTSPPSPQSSFITVQNQEDESYPPSEHESIETIRPSTSNVEIEPAIDEDMGGSFTVIEEGNTPLGQDNIQPESVIDDKSNPSTPPVSERPSMSPRGNVTPTVTTPTKASRSSPVNRQPVTPLQEKPRPQLISPFKSPAPAKFLGTSRVAEFLATSRKNSELFVKPLKTLGSPTSPIRSQLSTPRNSALKRPVLQNVNLNIPHSSMTSKANELGKSTTRNDAEVVAKQTLPLIKDLRKRRGVIMVERVNIDQSLNKVGHIRIKSQTRVHDLPSFPSSASADVFSDRRNDAVKGRSAKTTPESKNKDLVVSEPICRNDATLRSSEASFNAELEPSDQALQPIDAVSPTTLIVSRLVEQFSESDLGSLEMTSDEDDSDSECEEIPRVQNDLDGLPINLSTLPHIQRVPTEEASRTEGCNSVADEYISHAKDDNNDDDDLGSTSVLSGGLSAPVAASASGLSAPRSSRPATPYSKPPARTLNAKESERLSPSTSGSSYATSSSGSDSLPAKRGSRLPLFSLAYRLRHGNGSSTPVKETAAPSSLPVITRGKTSVPVVSPAESAKPLVPNTPRSTTKPLTGIWNMRNKTSTRTSEEAIPLTPPRKVAPSISTPRPKQALSNPGSSYQRTPPMAEAKSSKPSMGQSFMRRLSNVPVPRSKANPATTQSVRTDPTHLAPPSPGSLTKPRSHTINTVSPLPPSLSTPSPEALKASSTKPRSHTVNTYSPTTRSPLSRLAADASADYKATQQHEISRPNPVSPPQKFVPKLSSSSPSSSRTGAAAVKTCNTTLPLRVHKSSSAKRQASEETGPAPPTAAFMRPAASPASSNARRMTNSIAPLIPNWTPATAANGGMTPKQCRSMFRNSLSMVVR
ncbi:hypothetical protein CVT25_007943 [Psilocybe cyanescens]|uniref:Uncharacterized protein n=1 Tax=Psilocybe cyanescens TaxID=93625 RepID=A0A409XR62_PSICY|nr:hypothetical protein CVT25_007943 [Psilocybe cyanescens]